MPVIAVRQGLRTDAALIARFNQLMAEETEDKTLPDNKIQPGVERIFAEPDLGFYLVAEVDGVAAGSLMVTTEWSDWRNGLFWWIQSVYVDVDQRRKGVFEQLYATVKGMAQDNAEVCGLRLYVEKENVRAQQTYLKLGMEETHYRLFEEEF